ncbi:D-glucuronyl C5-epimerase family protein [Streptomyces wuyuanensis]|uniref:D-glucuronyl C5-epimerase family protein n=1 Tax=Streptomyces wuyuanensis TaxID=1196353 RepID=UPI003721DAC4
MAGTSHSAVNRRRFMHLAGGAAVAATAVATGSATAFAATVPGARTPVDPFRGISRSLALSLPRRPAFEPPLPPLPNQLEGGRIAPPSRRVPTPRSAPDPEAVQEDVPTSLPFTFNQDGYRAVADLPEPMRPWRDRPTLWENVTPDTKNTFLDAEGVIQYRSDFGQPGYDQPVTQIQFGLGCITSYRIEQDPDRKALFLTRAKAQAKRLIDTRVETRGAWYFPYPFDFTHSTHSGVDYQAPWYSGMAQGEAISLFIQLAQLDQVTEEERTLYRAAADGAFASLLRADDATPWVVNRNSAGYLWIQEYPGSTPGAGDYTYNGMIFALFGLWDYILATGNELAVALFDGACTTIDRYFPLLRNQRWISYYCQTHRIPTPSYHQHHINLFRQLHWQTGGPRFAHMTDQLTDDYPSALVPEGSAIAFAAGTHTLYQFDTDADGDYVASKGDTELARKTVTFTRATQAPANRRRRIMDRGIYYRISAGAYTGWWIGEYYPNAFLLGEYLPTTCHPDRTLTFPANTEVTCYRFGTDGSIGSTRTVNFANPSNAPFDRRSIVNGRPMYRITAGALTDYWVWTGDVLTDGN